MTLPSVTLMPGGDNFCHANGQWSIVLPVTRLDSWISFHRRMQARKGGVYGHNYAADIAALERFSGEQTQKEKEARI